MKYHAIPEQVTRIKMKIVFMPTVISSNACAAVGTNAKIRITAIENPQNIARAIPRQML